MCIMVYCQVWSSHLSENIYFLTIQIYNSHSNYMYRNVPMYIRTYILYVDLHLLADDLARGKIKRSF